jgi:hypothetical protein
LLCCEANLCDLCCRERAEGEDNDAVAAAAAAAGMERPGTLRAVFAPPEGADVSAEAAEATGAEAMLGEWDAFVQRTLHGILDHQMVGSYSNIANLSAMSQVGTTFIGLY